VIRASFASALFVAYSSQIAHGMHCTFDADFCLRIRLRRPSHDQRRAVLDVVKALAALDPAGFGLDDACAQLESSTYVMAEEARSHFGIDLISALTGCGTSRIVKISSMLPGIPPQSRQMRSAEADALRATPQAPLNKP
jgi:hypothetical protein